MPHEVVFSPEAREDLIQLYLFIAEQSGSERALAYTERLEAYCRSFANLPERGMRRDDLVSGLRVVGFERRVSLAFLVSSNTVTFVRVLYGGRDLGAVFQED